MAPVHRIRLFSPLALALALAACGSEAPPPAPAAPEAPAGISVRDGWMALPAVAGNPAAVYFTITNDGPEAQMIRAVNVAGAQGALLHQTGTWNGQVDMQEVLQVPVPAGESVVFEPGGLHVMAMSPDPSLQPGGETEVTLSFIRGDKISFPVEIRAAGDAPGGQ